MGSQEEETFGNDNVHTQTYAEIMFERLSLSHVF